MKIRRVKPGSLGKMQGAVMFILGLVVAVLSLITFALSGAKGGVGAIVVFIVFPIVYGVMGFLIGVFTAFIYNLVAGRVGGIEIEVENEGGVSSSVQ